MLHDDVVLLGHLHGDALSDNYSQNNAIITTPQGGVRIDDLQTLRGVLQLLRDTRGPWRPLTEVPGLPLRYAGSFGAQRYQGGGRLQRLSHHTLPAERFHAPGDYRIVSLLEMLSKGVAF